jgi:hypothetical protein
LGQALENFSWKSKDLFVNLNQLDIKAALINYFKGALAMVIYKQTDLFTN